MIATDIAVGAFALALLAAPGWVVARALRLAYPPVGGFVLSAVLFVNLVIALDALRVPLTLSGVGLGWAVVALTAGRIGMKTSRPRATEIPVARFAWRESWPLLLALVPATAAVVYRAIAQPLFGIDTIFRWNYLAEQMLARHTLDFYPPVTAADYAVYAWPDGIAPVISAIYFWSYLIAAAARPAMTAAAVIAQFALIVVCVYGIARRWFSFRAAVFASALIGCSPLVAWGTAMGQETGLMALGFLGMLLYLPREPSEENTASLVFAAAAAALGGLAREYGLVLPLLGLAFGLTRKLSPRALAIFGVVSLGLATPWYIRNALHTGNPLFGLPLPGGFAANGIHQWLNESFQTEFGWSALPPEAPRLVFTNCAAAIFGLVAGARYGMRLAPALCVSIGIAIALWALSIRHTAAGFIYSLRVLTPALALAAVLGGAALARWLPDRRRLMGVACGLFVFGLDATLRTLTLPANVYTLPPAAWLTVGGAVHAYHARPLYRELARQTAGKRLLVLGPNALLTRAGAETVPLWSPEVTFLFDESLSPAIVGERLRALRIGYVLLNTGPANERFLAHSRFFRDPEGALRLAWSDGDMVLLEVTMSSNSPRSR